MGNECCSERQSVDSCVD